MKKNLFLLIIFIFSYLFIFNRELILALACPPACPDPYVCRSGTCKIPPTAPTATPKPATPTPSPSPTPGPVCSFNDDFSSSTLNSTYWDFSTDNGGVISFSSGEAKLTLPVATSRKNMTFSSKNKAISGDFSAEILMKSLNTDNNKKAGSLELSFDNPDNSKIVIRASRYANYDLVASDMITSYTDGSIDHKDIGLTDNTPVKIKLERIGNQAGVYYDLLDGNGYKLAKVFNNVYTGPGYLSIRSDNFETDFPKVISVVDNFKLTCWSSLTPTVTPTIAPESGTEMTIPLTGTADFCSNLSIDKGYLGSVGDPGIKITSTAKIDDVATFGYAFYNLDNLDSAGKPKPIMFTASKPYLLGVNLTVSKKTQTINVSFPSIDRADLNWNFYMPKPKHIQVVGYFKNTSGTWSKTDNLCQVSFTANTIDPTPTPNAACVCATAGTCATACYFDKYPSGVTYSNPIKCNLGNDIFSSIPSSTNKNNWCQSYFKTKGDANADGRADLTDYFYYKSVRYGAKVPPNVNVDFDGDGFVTDSADKAVIFKSLNQ